MLSVGIIGFGVVGKSALTFLYNYPHISLQVWDERCLTPEELALIASKKATFFNSTKVLNDFIQSNDYVIVSPGVNLNAYAYLKHKFLSELDLFTQYFHKKTIAVTGSLGKTTVTKLLGSIIQQSQKNIRVLVGGNIGIGMLDLIQEQASCDIAVLELSSFQLERNKTFAPDYAIWTNWYPNHLDRHETAEEYFQAKARLISFQLPHQHAILCYDLWSKETLLWINNVLAHVTSRIGIYTQKHLHEIDISLIACHSFSLFYLSGNYLCVSLIVDGKIQSTEHLFNSSVLPDCTFIQNWIGVLALLYVSGCSLSSVQSFLIQAPHMVLIDNQHRLELCATINGIDFYDDSKSTVIQATIAAFQKLARQRRPILLILGGIAKGAVRGQAFETIKRDPLLKKVYCFGAECSEFVGCSIFASLEDIMLDIGKTASPGDIVLFSPSGASFDFFKNYGHRGEVFQRLAKALLPLSQNC